MKLEACMWGWENINNNNIMNNTLNWIACDEMKQWNYQIQVIFVGFDP